ncbi:MAG TPA: response regulator [Gemmataceae bacterium]|jgi:ActR/RegA family two-component response regulator|nr:response regulator [Gemmataceae bacterium]
MTTATEMPDTILVVDDEPAVRKTFQEWLEQSGFGCKILAAADAEQALMLANQQPIDLAILDWNLGAGADGLHLLQDLAFFHPDVVAILVTGYAQQATPLDAMRMGVRDYLDKNHDLDRPTFLKVVHNQLEQIRPAKRERRLHRSLADFREAVQRILPLVQHSGLLNDPVPVPAAIHSLFQFLLETTGASDSVLLVRSYDAERDPQETYRVYDRNGALLDVPMAPFASSLIGGAVSMQDVCIWQRPPGEISEGMVLQPFERQRQNILAAPMTVAPGVQAVIELFDKPGGFLPADKRVVRAGVIVGAELLRQVFAERQSQHILFDAVAAALGATESLAATIHPGTEAAAPQAPGTEALNSLRENLQRQLGPGVDSEHVLRLLQAVRDLAMAHGPAALRHCLTLVESTAALLEQSVSPEGEA